MLLNAEATPAPGSAPPDQPAHSVLCCQLSSAVGTHECVNAFQPSLMVMTIPHAVAYLNLHDLLQFLYLGLRVQGMCGHPAPNRGTEGVTQQKLQQQQLLHIQPYCDWHLLSSNRLVQKAQFLNVVGELGLLPEPWTSRCCLLWWMPVCSAAHPAAFCSHLSASACSARAAVLHLSGVTAAAPRACWSSTVILYSCAWERQHGVVLICWRKANSYTNQCLMSTACAAHQRDSSESTLPERG